MEARQAAGKARQSRQQSQFFHLPAPNRKILSRRADKMQAAPVASLVSTGTEMTKFHASNQPDGAGSVDKARSWLSKSICIKIEDGAARQD